MHQSGHSRAHTMHDVQLSSCSAMRPDCAPRTALTRTPLAGSGTPSGRLRPADGLPRLLRPWPFLRDPRGKHELLAQRMTLEAVRQQQRPQVGMARRSRCRTSRRSRARARPRRPRRRSASAALPPSRARGCASSRPRALATDHTRSTTASPASPSSYADSQSKKSKPSSCRAARSLPRASQVGCDVRSSTVAERLGVIASRPTRSCSCASPPSSASGRGGQPGT